METLKITKTDIKDGKYIAGAVDFEGHIEIDAHLYNLRQSGMTWKDVAVATSVPYGGVRERYLYHLGIRRGNGHRAKTIV